MGGREGGIPAFNDDQKGKTKWQFHDSDGASREDPAGLARDQHCQDAIQNSGGERKKGNRGATVATKREGTRSTLRRGRAERAFI